jgi:hypothetical protein
VGHLPLAPALDAAVGIVLYWWVTENCWVSRLPAALAYGLIRRGCSPANLASARYAMAARRAWPTADRGTLAQQTRLAGRAIKPQLRIAELAPAARWPSNSYDSEQMLCRGGAIRLESSLRKLRTGAYISALRLLCSALFALAAACWPRSVSCCGRCARPRTAKSRSAQVRGNGVSPHFDAAIAKRPTCARLR